MVFFANIKVLSLLLNLKFIHFTEVIMNYKNLIFGIFSIIFLGCVQFAPAMELPLNLRAQQTNDILFKACNKGNIGLVKHLIENNCVHINIEGPQKFTPLHVASLYGHINLVEYLLEKKADVNAKNAQDITPLHLACKNKSYDLVEYLIEKGADIDAKNNEQLTPLFVACEEGELRIVKYLVEKQHADLGAKNCNKDTLLHTACGYGHLHIVEYLINKGADVNAKNYDQMTPLHAASTYGYIDIMKYLINKGAMVDAENYQKCTPLHIAVGEGHRALVQYLLNSIPTKCIDMQTIDGFTALDLAYMLKKEDIIKLFKQHGIRTISEQEAEKNMRALFAELDTETQQAQEKREQRKQKKSQKKHNAQNKQVANQSIKNKTNTNNNNNANINQNVKPVGNNVAQLVQSTETGIEPINFAEQAGSQVTSHDNSSNTIDSPVSSINNSSESKSKKALVNTTKKQENNIQAPSNKPEQKGQPIQNNNEYQVSPDKNLKWPRSLNGAQYNNMRDHFRQLKQGLGAPGLDIQLLKGQPGKYRLRVGGYRVLFTVDKELRRIIICEIGLRKKVYRSLKS